MEHTTERKAFNFYKSYFDVYNELSDKDKLLFIDALLKKEFWGLEPELKGMAKFAYLSQKHSIDSQVEGFEYKTNTKLNAPTVPPTVPPTVQEKEKEKEKEKEEIPFILFWDKYHSITKKPKTDRHDSEKYWYKLKEDEKQKAIDNILNYSKTQSENKYLKKARTYLSDKNFNDEFESLKEFTHVEYKYIGQSKIVLPIEQYEEKKKAILMNEFDMMPKYIKL